MLWSWWDLGCSCRPKACLDDSFTFLVVFMAWFWWELWWSWKQRADLGDSFTVLSRLKDDSGRQRADLDDSFTVLSRKSRRADFACWVFGPKIAQNWPQKWSKKWSFFGPFLGPVFSVFRAPFWGPKPPQNEPTWHPKAIPKGHDSDKKRFWKLLFCIVFYSKSGTPGLPRELQDSQETSQEASKWPTGACPKKGSNFWLRFDLKSDPKLGSKTAPKVVQKLELHLSNENGGQNGKCCKVCLYLEVQILSQK